ncbi:MAG TPA: peptidoglycan-binding domain-containing protein [Acidimicrobiales bacterium]|nr:peptidoglycan-binding domain-containing protein [Acidimicrobiales bacterium]
MTRAADGSVFVVPRTSVQRALDVARARVYALRRIDVARARVYALRRIDGEQRRWLAAAGLTMAALIAATVVPGAPLPPAAARLEAAAASAVSAADPAPAPGPYTPTAPPASSTIPIGKGMWLHHFSRSAGGDPQRLVADATARGLTHVYLRLGSSTRGFYAQSDLERLLPVAHAAGLKVVGWDFPTLHSPAVDAARAAAQITYTTVQGHRIDAFSADIETPAEGTHLTVEGVRQYGQLLRQAAGPGYPLIATVPRPSNKRWFPYAETVAAFDAVAPMVYWANRDPVRDVRQAVADLAPYGKPVLPVGQAYDGRIDGWGTGSPSKEALAAFAQAASEAGAVGVSFWSWQTAEPHHWAAIAESAQFSLQAEAVAAGDVHAVRYLQRVLAAVGQPTAVDGTFAFPTQASLEGFQRLQGLRATGRLDGPTVAALTRSWQTPVR